MARDPDFSGQGYRASMPRHRLYLLHALAHYIREDRGPYEFRERSNGDGSGTPPGRLRLEIEVDATAFWRTVTEVRGHRSRSRLDP